MKIYITPPLELENLLPYDFSYVIYDHDNRQQLSGYLRKGLYVPIHSIQLDHLIGLRIEIEDAGLLQIHIGTTLNISGFGSSEVAIINNPGDYGEDKHIDIKSKNTDNELRLILRTQYDRIKFNFVNSICRILPFSGGSRRISVISPYVIINKSGQDLIVKTKSIVRLHKRTNEKRMKR